MSMEVIKGLVAKVQRAQVESFDEKLRKEREDRRALRKEGTNNISELLEHYANPDKQNEEPEVAENEQPERSEQPVAPTGSIPPPPIST